MMANVFKLDGVKTMYNGLLPNILGVLAYKGFGFFTFEHMKALQKNTHTPMYMDSFIAASIAGFAGQFVSYPMEIVKRKYMVISKKDKVYPK